METRSSASYPSIPSFDSTTTAECIPNEERRHRFPIRTLIAALGVSVCLVMSSTRYNLPVAMVSMVHDSCTPNAILCGEMTIETFFKGPLHEKGNPSPNRSVFTLDLDPKLGNVSPSLSPLSNLTSSVYHSPRNAKECNADDKTHQNLLRWGEVKQGIALGVYYYGFTFTSIFGGRLAENSPFGPKWIVGLGMIGSAVFNSILPPAARLSFGAFMIVRILTGACHGVILPALFYLFQNWFPKREHTLALSFLLIGTAFGLVINVLIVKVIKDFHLLNGWPLLFYGGSLLHVVLFVLWWYFVTDKPESHGMVREREVSYIRQNSRNILEEKLNSAPWKAIVKSKTLYASMIAKFCWSFNHAIIIDNGPSYLNRVAGFDWVEASICIALVYLLTSLVYLLTSPFFNYLESKSSLSKTRLRKIFQCLVFLGASMTMFALPVVGCDERAIVTLIATNMLFQGFIAGGEFPMSIDYAGNYAGTVFGIVSVPDSVGRFLAPFIRGELIQKNNSLHNWNVLFTVSAILNLIGWIVFEICADAKLQSWAMKKELTRELSDEGEVTNVKLDKTSKRIVVHEAQHNPHFRLPINTNNEDWKNFKVSTLVQ